MTRKKQIAELARQLEEYKEDTEKRIDSMRRDYTSFYTQHNNLLAKVKELEHILREGLKVPARLRLEQFKTALDTLAKFANELNADINLREQNDSIART